ncbi:MAG: hypothetical protein QM751_00470 [Paludibacteraceae bacterium]
MNTEDQKTTKAIFKKETHFIKYVLGGMFLIILIILVVAFINIHRLKVVNAQQKLTYQSLLDSVHTADMVTVSKVFSWAVRSDLLRKNTDQAQLHLDNIQKEPHIKKAYVIDANTNQVILSTDRKDIGIPFSDFTVINVNETVAQKGSDVIRLVSPIMELNKKLGVSVVEIDTDY